MTLEKLLEMLTESDIQVDNAEIIVRKRGYSTRGEWYSDRILEFIREPMKAWNVSCGEDELKIMCMY